MKTNRRSFFDLLAAIIPGIKAAKALANPPDWKVIHIGGAEERQKKLAEFLKIVESQPFRRDEFLWDAANYQGDWKWEEPVKDRE